MSRYRLALLALAGFAALTILVTTVVRPAPPTTATGTGSAALIPAEQRSAAPDFTGIDGWLNTQPLTVQALRNKVVLIDFWTFSCVNCVRTIPHLQALQRSFGGRLVIVGVHSPEFDFEKVRDNVAAAVSRLGVTWPVALDSRMSTWNAYDNQYWPAEYLLDQQGRIAYLHAGEGDDDVTTSAVAALLGITASPAPVAPTPDAAGETPELYAGSDRGRLADGETYGTAGQAVDHPDGGPPHDSDRLQVTGRWVDHGEYLESASPGHVRLDFAARDVYVVAGSGSAAPATIAVTEDGAPVSAAHRGPDLGAGGLDVTGQQLYHLLTGVDGGRHLIDLAVPAGFRLYTFTFG